MSNKSDPEDSRSMNSDKSLAHEDTEEEDEGANKDADIGHWGVFGGHYTSHPGDLYVLLTNFPC
jgi:hypothetical protein